MKNNFLTISEEFYSLQGEGPSTGKPAIFLRLAACNLNCPGFSYQDPMSKKHLGCDTKLIWKKGKRVSIEKILLEWEEKKFLEQLKNGAHLVITGGEPLLQENRLETFIKNLDQILSKVFIEIETNGTILPTAYLKKRINQFNVSPKLISSGENRQIAYQTPILQEFNQLSQTIFKFVIQNYEDVKEVIDEYQIKLNIPNSKIWLMPEGGDQKTFFPKMKDVAEWCKQHHFNFSNRLHIMIWDEATGV